DRIGDCTAEEGGLNRQYRAAPRRASEAESGARGGRFHAQVKPARESGRSEAEPVEPPVGPGSTGETPEAATGVLPGRRIEIAAGLDARRGREALLEAERQAEPPGGGVSAAEEGTHRPRQFPLDP